MEQRLFPQRKKIFSLVATFDFGSALDAKTMQEVLLRLLD